MHRRAGGSRGPGCRSDHGVDPRAESGPPRLGAARVAGA
jgi:hypothetical protein